MKIISHEMGLLFGPKGSRSSFPSSTYYQAPEYLPRKAQILSGDQL